MDALISRAERIARSALTDFGLPLETTLAFVKQRENTVFRADASGRAYAIRVARPGYRTDAHIASEVSFVRALRARGVDAPDFVLTTDGAPAAIRHDGDRRFQIVVQEWIDDARPIEDIDRAFTGVSDLTPDDFAAIGALAARLHAAGAAIGRPESYDRPAWDAAGLVGPTPVWGDPGALAEHSDADAATLRAAAASLTRLLDAVGTDAGVFGVLHADLTPENLLRRADRSIAVIDFDDSGEGWHAFDLATVLFFFQPHPRYAQLRAALEKSYAATFDGADRTLALLDPMILARGMTYLGWAGDRRGDETAEFLAAEVRPLVLELARRHLAATA